MPTLPTGGTVPATTQVQVRSQPSLTWLVDPNTKRIAGTADGYAVMQQAVEIILNVQRFYWQIYSPAFGMDYRNLLGSDPGFVASNLKRRLQEAFSVDDGLLGLQNYRDTVNGERLHATFTVRTVYGDLDEEAEVTFG